MSDPRFFIEHGVIHDRETGKHVVTDGEPPFEDSVEQVCELLNSLSEKRVTILPHDDEDMAAVGRAFMEAIEQARISDPWVKDWSPAQCPSEIIFDLLNRMDEQAKPSRYFISQYTDGPATRWNVIDRQTQEWVRRFQTETDAQQYADNLNGKVWSPLENFAGEGK